MKPHLNYFCSGVCVKIENDKINILTAHYYDSSDHKKTNEIRLPGGTVQFNDVEVAMEKSASRIGLRSDQLGWVVSEIQKIEKDYKRQTENMTFQTNMDKILVRNRFTTSLADVAEAIESLFLDDKKIKIIENECKLATLRRELEEETATTHFADAIECGFMERNDHYQYPFLILGSDAPDKYTGSPDPDIRESSYLPLQEVCESLYKNHKPFLNNILKQWSQILQYEKGKNHLIEQIKDCLMPN